MKGYDIKVREFTELNLKDVYANINQLIIEIFYPYGKTSKILEHCPRLLHKFDNILAPYPSIPDSLQCVLPSSRPLENKRPALRLIDFIVSLPPCSIAFKDLVYRLPYIDWCIKLPDARFAKRASEWKRLAQGNAYLK